MLIQIPANLQPPQIANQNRERELERERKKGEKDRREKKEEREFESERKRGKSLIDKSKKIEKINKIYIQTYCLWLLNFFSNTHPDKAQFKPMLLK